MGAAAVIRSRLGTPLNRDVAVAAGALWTLTAVPAVLLAAVPGAGAAVRGRLGFALSPYAGSTGELLDIAATNGRVVATLALAAWAGSRVPALRPLSAALAGLIVVSNAGLVGVALGAYGARALPWIIHLPVEWAALALVLGLHRSGRSRPLRAAACAARTAVALTLVAVGAVVETFLTPQA